VLKKTIGLKKVVVREEKFMAAEEAEAVMEAPTKKKKATKMIKTPKNRMMIR
jgi:putative transposon-encoded protein